MAVTPDGSKLYVADGGGEMVVVISTVTNSIITQLGFEAPIGITIAAPVVQSVPKSGHKCNGVYSGTFNGSIRVAAWQNCVFLNGGQIAGDVQVVGNFVLSDAMVGGNVTVFGTGSCTLGPGGDYQRWLSRHGYQYRDRPI
jgi:YVTN family beta-propeller protein